MISLQFLCILIGKIPTNHSICSILSYFCSLCNVIIIYKYKGIWVLELKMNFITAPWKYTFINKSCCRNSPVNCDVFPRLNLHHWKTDSPALQVPEAILIQTLEKGTQGLAQRRKEEYKLWELSEYIQEWIIL